MRPARNVARRAPVTARLAAETPAPAETAVRIAISKMAIRSSTISTPKTISRELAFDALLLERLGDDRRAGDRDDRAGEHALERRPAEQLAEHVADPASCRWSRATATRPAVGPICSSFRRLNSSPSENIRRMTPSSDSVWTISSSATSGIGDVWADDHPREQVAEDHRLAETLEQHRRNRGDAQDECEILQEFVCVLHELSRHSERRREAPQSRDRRRPDRGIPLRVTAILDSAASGRSARMT